jgi:arsenite methyltransferase
VRPFYSALVAAHDPWAEWVRKHRFGGDELLMRRMLQRLYPIRDQVLDRARISHGDVVLDVGTGDGLIGFGALDRVGPAGRVIFSDISRDLLAWCQELASQTKDSRCEFLHASADDLSAVPSNSVDAVTTRAVLIYVSDKLKALREFYRVLRPGGRISVHEPINRFMAEKSPEWSLYGYDVRPVMPLAEKVRATFEEANPSNGDDPMCGFDERDLFAWTEQAGFAEIHLAYRADSEPAALLDPVTWETFLATSPNPLAPTFGEILNRALTSPERDVFEAHLRPLVEAGEGRRVLAKAHIWATK